MAEQNEPLKNKGGRPTLTPEEIERKKQQVITKIEPYLKGGLSVNKALGESKIRPDDFYYYMRTDEGFRDKINQFRNFVAILTNNALIKQLMVITAKQNPPMGKKAPSLSKEEVKFLQWVALNSNLTKDEWGERRKIEMFDPEAEIQKIKAMLEQGSTKEIQHDDDDLIDNE